MVHMAAKLHYEADLPQVEIARRLGVSTATVSRLIQRARAEGIVRIEVRDLAAPEALAAELRERLGLRAAAVIDAPPGQALPGLAAPLGALLLEMNLAPGAVLAIGWGRAVREIIRAGLPPLPGVLTVAATGGMQQHAAHFQINEFVRLAAEQTGGTPHFLHAPYLPGGELREVFLADPAIAETVALWDRVDVAILGVGLPHGSNGSDPAAPMPGEDELAGAAGDVIRHYFRADGGVLDWTGERRMIAMSTAQLRGARLAIGVASGTEKAMAIAGAARAGLISGLVTDATTAEAVLAIA
ncbi:winged helix-turn-helix transcriptional regulator [Arsenicitalea aurantiaca]|uniref:Winged helix-turn-helix transcriptional regulator n=1 Tax=Arsenicitalea aurantiaca TaxID=1783274 RepID=A0A433XBC0_9HYPH|nr:sugar-binding domain-containing protein [Arsenicitalea aurantiaca]RUT31362.1 winged helix-turn-helix transcriptional regulator [Arsenicitalea aurantiaca]